MILQIAEITIEGVKEVITYDSETRRIYEQSGCDITPASQANGYQDIYEAIEDVKRLYADEEWELVLIKQ